MATNKELISQVRITNLSLRKDGTPVPKILSIKASVLPKYIASLTAECNKFESNRSSKFNYLPMLSILDAVDTGEEFTFEFEDELPKETVKNSRGVPILIIIPEEDIMSIGTNRFDLLVEEDYLNFKNYIKSIELNNFFLA